MSLFESKPAPTDSCKDPVNEDRWLDVFRKWLPQRYGIAPGWVIDSFGGRRQLLNLIISMPWPRLQCTRSLSSGSFPSRLRLRCLVRARAWKKATSRGQRNRLHPFEDSGER